MKREVCINGKVLFPLQEGNAALIAKSGQYIRTSPVVAICEENEEYAHFETQNSIYRVSMKPIANAARAILPPFLLMCA